MENSDIDMVISIPDTPESVVRRGSIRREVKRRPHSPEAPVGCQREEYRNYLNGRNRGRQVPEVGENREKASENGHHRSRSSGSALFRRPDSERGKGKSISIDLGGARVDGNPVLNLNKGNGHAHDTASRCLRFEDVREFRSSNGCPPLQGDHNSCLVPGNSNKGKGKVDCASLSNRETIDLSSDRKPNRGTKRLVRFGCISPEGIAARAKRAADTNSEDIVNVEPEVAAETTSSVDIREIVSGNDIHRRARGKRPETPHGRVASRDAVGSELEGWIRTRDRKLNIGHEMNRRDERVTVGICGSVSRLDVHESDEVESDARPQRLRRNEITTSRAANEPEVSVIGSSGEPSSSRPPRTHNHQRSGTQVLEIEDSSPEVRVARGPRRVENDESDLKARQMEADEILARELQEQLYQETTLMRNELVDENIARFLEQEENSLHASSSRNTRSSNTIAANRGGRSRLEARLQQHSIRRRLNPPQPRAAVRAPPRGRGHRLGRSSASLHRALNGGFPDAMGLELRMDFLEELENVIGHSINNSNLLHMDRDFTEDDYELLLALDDNNHRHAGASTHRINNLPESTVQTDNQETCVICLDTPTIGDTIRHLPCFHKFHKDCIDPWLGRSKQCPVCKSSVT